MKKLSLVLILLAQVACTTIEPKKNDNVVVTGTRINKADLEGKEPVMIIKKGESGNTSINDLLSVLAQRPFDADATCAEAIEALESKGYTILSIQKDKVITDIPNTTHKLTFSFADDKKCQ